jgi:hypothetical protein
MAIGIITTNNRAVASVANVSYILRDSATACWTTHNLENIKDKSDALSYAEQRAFEEDLTPLWGAAERRNHIRLELTFASETNPEEALRIAKNFLENNFPEAKIILSSHKNTDHCHVHCWVDNRAVNGNKLRMDNSRFYKFGEKWSKHCDSIYKTNYTKQFKESKTKHNAEKKQGEYSNKWWEKLKEGNIKNEQRTITAGKQLIARAGQCLNQSGRRIDELKQLQFGNDFGLAAVGGKSSERQWSSSPETRREPIQPLEKTTRQSTPTW